MAEGDLTRGDPFSVAAKAVAAAALREQEITALVEGALRGSGGVLRDLETRMKTVESAARKIASIAARRQVDPQAAAGELGDVIRYRAVVPAAGYALGVTRSAQLMKTTGAEVVDAKDLWADSRYKGLNVTWLHHGQRFEVQYHTPASHAVAAGAEAHRLYEMARGASGASRSQIDREMKRLWKSVDRPKGSWVVE